MTDVEALPSHFQPLPSEECWNRLRAARHGRLATTSQALPVVLPVSITLEDDDTLLLEPLAASSLPGPKRAVVALEIGELAGPDGVGWTVLAQGFLAREVSADGRGRFRMHCELVSGWITVIAPPPR